MDTEPVKQCRICGEEQLVPYVCYDHAVKCVNCDQPADPANNICQSCSLKHLEKMATGNIEQKKIVNEPVPSIVKQQPPTPEFTGCKYHRTIYGIDGGAVKIDVYRVLIAFGVKNPGLQHAIKKLLCAGIRGKNTTQQDLIEAIDAVKAAIEIERQIPNGKG